MAIYRPARRRWPAAVGLALAGGVVGLLAGWLLRGAADPVEVARALKADLAAAAGTLEIVEIEYRESVEDGEVVSEREYRGARAALARSRQRYEEARGSLVVLDAARAAEIDRGFGDVASMLQARADEEEVATAVAELRASLVGTGG